VERKPGTTREVVTRVEEAPSDEKSVAAATEAAFARPLAADPIQAVEDRLSTERRDDGWAPGAEVTLTTTFRDSVPGSSLGEVRCSASVCRMTFAHGGTDGPDQLRRTLASRPNPLPDSAMLVQPDEKESRVFVARPGHSLMAKR
jgi:hypothetical protein